MTETGYYVLSRKDSRQSFSETDSKLLDYLLGKDFWAQLFPFVSREDAKEPVEKWPYLLECTPPLQQEELDFMDADFVVEQITIEAIRVKLPNYLI